MSEIAKIDEGKVYFRCRKCGFSGCRKQREQSFPRGNKAGEGKDFIYTSYTAYNSAGTPYKSSMVTYNCEKYYAEVTGGCPVCGTYLWDEGEEIGT